jgi:uncharacterized protein YndB with AHSA1/START domain
MLNHIISRIHFDQSPERVLDYLSTPKFWPDWHAQSRRIEGGPNGPMQVGDSVTEYIAVRDQELAAQWTVVDRWESKMYRIDGRIIMNGKVQQEVVIAIHYTLFATQDGGTDFAREIEFTLPVADLDGFKKLQDESLRNVKRILEQSK